MIIVVLFLQSNIYSQTLYNGIGHIPLAYQEIWTKAGLLQDMNTVEPKLVIFMNPGDISSQIGTALTQARNHVNSTNGLAIIYFPEGTFYLNTSISLNQNDKNIVFQGDGSDKTTLVFQNIANSHCFYLAGAAGDWSSSSDLDQNFNKGDSILHAATGEGLSSISPGDWVHFVKYNFDYHTSHGSLIPDIVGQITKLEAKSTDATGEWGEIKDVANMNYEDSPNTLYSLKIRKITPIRNIGIEDLKIMRTPNTKAGDDYYVYNIYFNFAINCWLRGVESYKPSRSHLAVSRSTHLEISGCYFHEAMDYGGDGWGYGVVLGESTTNTLVKNNIFRYLRHALTASAGSNCNVWTFNYSREQHSTYWLGIGYDDRDLDLHAKYPFGHLFEHNIVERIASDDYHGDNGPYNTFVRNMATGGDFSRIKTMHEWAILGNMEALGNNLYPLRYNWEFAPAVDVYGFLSDYTLPVAHNVAYDFGAYSSYRLDDVSYYYSSKPVFLDGYTWPTIGPETRTSGGLSYSIPAYDRFSLSKKTYLTDPTPHSYYLSGTYNQNLTLKDNVYITGDITIASGYTLTLMPGTIVRANTGIRITVNGTLKAEGTSSQKITFTRAGTSGSWYGIRFEDSSVDANCIIKYCDIQYSSYGVYCNRANPKIENNTFGNNTYAIYLYYSSPSIKTNSLNNDRIYADHSNPYMYDNLINNPFENYAIYLFQSSPNLYHNTIEGLFIDYAVKAYSYSSPHFGAFEDTVSAYNRIETSGGDFALLAEDHAMPFLGSTYNCTYRGKKNTVMSSDNISLISAWSYSMVDAQYVWWGQYPAPAGWFYADGTSYLNYSHALSSDPGGGSTLGKNTATEGIDDEITVLGPLAPIECDSLWRKAEQARSDGNNKNALTTYQTLMSQHSNTAYAHYALARTINLQEEGDTIVLINTLEGLAADSKLDAGFIAAALDGLLSACNRVKETKRAIEIAENIVNSYPKSVHAYTALFKLFSIYLKDLGDVNRAKAVLETLKEKYPDRELTLIARYEMGEEVNWKLAKGSVPQNELPEKIPSAFSLGMNYPNPFNPATIIPFAVPEEAQIKIAIYDLLGREVAVLVDGKMAAGLQQVSWDGCDRSGVPVAAGVYFYRLQTDGYSQSRKLMLLK